MILFLLSFLILDKNKNNIHHLTGQEILKKIISLLKFTKSGDTLVVFFSFRYGGEYQEEKFIAGADHLPLDL